MVVPLHSHSDTRSFYSRRQGVSGIERPHADASVWTRGGIPVDKVCSQIPACSDDPQINAFIASHDKLAEIYGIRPSPQPVVKGPRGSHLLGGKDEEREE